MQPYFNPGPSDAVIPPIWLGAVNVGMCELAGAVAQGVVTHSTNSDPGYLRDVVRPALRRGAAGRDTEPVIIASAAIATGDSDEAVSRERERQRRMLAFLYSTPSYATSLNRRGWAELPEQLRQLVRAQRWDDLPAVLSDAVLDELLICARYDELPEFLTARCGDVADGVVLPPLDDRNDDGPLRACISELRRRR
jgi:alkanesulfonate monooxygenase SsuD/methylene tetrahydromethanopterin reductase-like flavin-dependent oxidoreductase (luciferase family)